MCPRDNGVRQSVIVLNFPNFLLEQARKNEKDEVQAFLGKDSCTFSLLASPSRDVHQVFRVLDKLQSFAAFSREPKQAKQDEPPTSYVCSFPVTSFVPSPNLPRMKAVQQQLTDEKSLLMKEVDGSGEAEIREQVGHHFGYQG